ncbi:MAG: helix-hairpin-helix domain-containing protein [Pseudomonadota bacterium]
MLLALATSNALADPVNVNTASAEQIAEQLTGVGITKARAIVAYRNANGRFTDLKALTNVTGIGERTLELNKGNIIIELPKQTKSRQK